MSDCICDGAKYEEQRHPFLVHPDCPAHRPPADRDDLDAILAKHEPSYQVDGDYGERQWIECTCDSEYFVDTDAGWAEHRAHVAQMVLESDWLRERDAAKWQEGVDELLALHGGTRSYWLTRNPYRADRVDAEDGGPQNP